MYGLCKQKEYFFRTDISKVTAIWYPNPNLFRSLEKYKLKLKLKKIIVLINKYFISNYFAHKGKLFKGKFLKDKFAPKNKK